MVRARRHSDQLKKVAHEVFFEGQDLYQLNEGDPDFDIRRSRRFKINYEPRAKTSGDWRDPVHQVMLRVFTPPNKNGKASSFGFPYNGATQSEDIFKVIVKGKFDEAVAAAWKIKAEL